MCVGQQLNRDTQREISTLPVALAARRQVSHLSICIHAVLSVDSVCLLQRECTNDHSSNDESVCHCVNVCVLNVMGGDVAAPRWGAVLYRHSLYSHTQVIYNYQKFFFDFLF
jgi:hypothetical protein